MNKNSSTLLKSSNHIRANVESIEAIKKEKETLGGRASAFVKIAGISES